MTSIYAQYKILIAADRFQTHGALASFLTAHGFQVYRVNNSPNALTMVLNEKPQIVIINLLGDQLNAVDFCTELYKTDPKVNTKVLVVSESRRRETILSVISAGASDYVLSPFKNEDMLNRVKYHLRKIQLIEAKEITSVLHDERVDTIYRVLEILSKGLSPHETLYEITRQVNHVLPVKRCNFVGGNTLCDVGYVAASNDNPDFEGFKIDIEKYPEVRQVMQTGKVVVIEDMANDPIMSDIKKEFKNIDFNSIIVVPVFYREAVVGVLSIRAQDENKIFTPEEIRICQLIGIAAAQALGGWREINKELLVGLEM